MQGHLHAHLQCDSMEDALLTSSSVSSLYSFEHYAHLLQRQSGESVSNEQWTPKCTIELEQHAGDPVYHHGYVGSELALFSDTHLAEENMCPFHCQGDLHTCRCKTNGMPSVVNALATSCSCGVSQPLVCIPTCIAQACRRCT